MSRETASEAQSDPEYVYGEEVEFGVEGTLDVLGLAETVLLARKQEVPNWQTL
jgi:hypothetical protein